MIDDKQTEENRSYMMGEIMFTIYTNEANLFTIARLNIHETNESAYEEDDIVITGYFGNLQEGVLYTFYGQLFEHKSYGLQYKVDQYETYVPKTEDGLIEYLSSDLFPGVGKRTATNIVEHFGEKAIERILDEPDRLKDVPRLNEKTGKSLLRILKEQRGFEQVAIKLTSYGLSLKMAQQLYKYYKEDTLSYIETNPYDFVLEVEGFGFPTADKIAEFNKIDKLDQHRIQASGIYALQNATLNGHVYLPLRECIDDMRKILRVPNVTDDVLIDHIATLDEEGKLVIFNEKVYLPSLHYAETSFSTHLKRLLEKKVTSQVKDEKLKEIIETSEEDESIVYGNDQFTAIKAAIHSKVMILTGGPGTGKTTVIKAILQAYASLNDLSLDVKEYTKRADYPFILTAPTGRAAKRLEQSTGIKAMTIHSLLGWDGHDVFEKNEYDRLSGKFIIIDEFSMVDTWLANHLFKAIPDHMQVLIVGDEDQLPSVGPGQVLADLLQTVHIPFVQLTEVYRQKDGSKIIDIAHSIKQNTCTENELKNASDFSFLKCNERQVLDAVTTVFERAVKKGYNPYDIQILAPMYRTEAGIHAINVSVQQFINPQSDHKREVHFNDLTYRVGDRVIQLVNQPEDKVFNGDIGKIVQIFRKNETEDKEEQIVVQYDETDVLYKRSDYINMMHAYCISIHKSQGSEFPIVILPVVKTYRRMLRKNLLYTAVTRSTQSLVICGDMDAFLTGIKQTDIKERYTSLKEQIANDFGDTDDDKVTFIEEVETPVKVEENLSEEDIVKEMMQNLVEFERYDVSPFDFEDNRMK
ncbi:MAG TPA: ATP-dependent RecD-like DNA helicase [Pseudogracilibacillus sp.]|nr:ATP-dependent RecD-like DNA helicase [Pseudogracilibacillus sp.]